MAESDLTTADILAALLAGQNPDQGRPRSPVPEWLLGQQREAQAADAPLHGNRFPSELIDTLANAGMLATPMPSIRLAKPLVGAGLGALLASTLSSDQPGAGEQPGSSDAEIVKLQTEIAKHQRSLIDAQKEIGLTKFRGIGEEAGMARQKALEEAARPYNDAIAQAQARIAQIRNAGDEKANALTRIERQANELRKQESARGKPFNQTPIGAVWENMGPLGPALVGAGTSLIGRLGHGPGIGWKLPVAEGTIAGAASTNVPTGWDAFFSPVRNPEKKGFETYGQELKLAEHPRAQEWLDYANTLPEYNPTREKAQEEFFDPRKAAERMAFGAVEGGVGAGTGLASAIGLERLGRGLTSGIKSLFGSRSPPPTGPGTPPTSGGGPGQPGSPGTATATPAPPPAAPPKGPPSPNQQSLVDLLSQKPPANINERPVPYRVKGKDGKHTWHDPDTGDFSSPPTKK